MKPFIFTGFLLLLFSCQWKVQTPNYYFNQEKIFDPELEYLKKLQESDPPYKTICDLS